MYTRPTAIMLALSFCLVASHALEAATRFELRSTIAFTSTRDNLGLDPTSGAEIYLCDPDGTNVRRLTVNTAGDGFPALSPDGKKLVFDSARNRPEGLTGPFSELFTMDVDGTRLVPLVRGSSGTWSPDGKEIAYHASASGTGTPIRNEPGAPATDSDIFTLNIDHYLDGTAAPVNITNTPDVIEDDADWSPDGQTIIFTAHPTTDSPTNSPHAEIYRINRDGTGLTRLTDNLEEERAASWSPDGTKIVFMGRRNGTDFELITMNADGSNQLQLTDNLVIDATPTWSPDGQKITFHRLVTGTFQLFQMNADGTGVVQLTTPPGLNLFANWGELRVKVEAAAASLAPGAAADVTPPTCIVTTTDFGTINTCTGTLADGGIYSIRVPSNWNGTLLLWSLGYIPPGTIIRPLTDAPDQPTAQGLLAQGYALAGSYAGPGWVIAEAIRDQLETLDVFESVAGHPQRTIAWGSSFGGLISPLLVEKYPDRFDGAVAACAVCAGGVASWNTVLDAAFAVQQLLGPQLEIVHITNPGSPTSGNLGLAEQILFTAQATPAGRARIALASALADFGGWIGATAPEPAPDDYHAREAAQFQWLTQFAAGFLFAFRADLEARMGGNPSWNTGVNYEQQLEKSDSYAEVVALYAEAGLSLEGDLDRLKDAPRISADVNALALMNEQSTLNGNLHGHPMLTIHALGDGIAVDQYASAYRDLALDAQDAQLLRQAFINRSGDTRRHCYMTPAENMAAVHALVNRLDFDRWEDSADPEPLNQTAIGYGPTYNVLLLGSSRPPTAPAFVSFEPLPFLRPWDPLPGAAAAWSGSGTLEPVRERLTLRASPSPYRGGTLAIELAASGASGGRSGRVEVGIYDVQGRLVRRVLASAAEGGRARAIWDGRDVSGRDVSAGIYFARASAGHGREVTSKFVVVR